MPGDRPQERKCHAPGTGSPRISSPRGRSWRTTGDWSPPRPAPLGWGLPFLLKFIEQQGRFAGSGDGVARQALDYVAAQVRVDGSRFGEYRWSGRTIGYHRAQIRDELGFRWAPGGDEAKLTRWLAEKVAPSEPSDELLRPSSPGAGPCASSLPAGRTASSPQPGPRQPKRSAAGPSPVPEGVVTRVEALLDDDAAGSLLEGLVESLTVTRLGVPPTLARTLRSTNAIESMIEICRDHSTNVKRWRDGHMALR